MRGRRKKVLKQLDCRYAIEKEALDEILQQNPQMNANEAAEIFLDDLFGDVYQNESIRPDDDYIFETKNEDEARGMLEELAKITVPVKYPITMIDLFTVGYFDGHDLLGWFHNLYGTYSCKISIEQLKRAGADSTVMKDLLELGVPSDREGRQLMLLILRKNPLSDFDTQKEYPIDPDEIYFFTALALPLIARWLWGITGKCPFLTEVSDRKARAKRNAAFRDFQYTYHEDTEAIHFQARFFKKEKNELKKIYAAFSGKYGYLPQHELLIGAVDLEKSASSMGRPVLRSFRADHQVTEIWWDFPEKALEIAKTYNLPNTIIPMFYQRTSDTGKSSAVIRCGYRLEHTNAYGFTQQKAISRKHTKKASVKSLLEDIDKSFWSEYTKLPQRLMELLQMNPVPDPAKETEKILEVYGFRSVFGDADYASIRNKMMALYGPLPYTPYDIAINFIQLMEEFEEDRDYIRKDKLREKITQVVFSYKF